MKVLMIGGIFGGSAEFRRTKMQETTETILVDGLRARGVEVTAAAHQWWSYLDDFDLVHMHHLASGSPQFLVRRKVPLIFTRHATKSLPVHHDLLWRLLRQRVSRLIALSERERLDLSRLVGSAKVVRIYNGIRSEGFDLAVRSYVPGAQELELLYVGQLVEPKRVHLAIDLVRSLRDEGHLARLTVISHKESLREELELYGRASGVGAAIRWVSGATRSAIADAMRGAHLLVLPSRTEALSTVAIEACLTGLPVLAFNVGGMAEQLPEGWADDEPEEVSRWIERGHELACSYASAAAVFAAHADTVRRTFAVPQMIDAHMSLYQEVLGDDSPSRD